jgi:hypothetical protein
MSKEDRMADEVIKELEDEVELRAKVAMRMHDNPSVLRLIAERMALGAERYGHGVRVSDDTRQWGTDIDSWTVMALEEALDGMIYLASEIIRIKHRRLALLELRGATPPNEQSNATQGTPERKTE